MSLLARLAQLEANGTPVAVCMITRSTGVTPRHIGAKMLVTKEGRIDGTIGGGEAEQLVIEKSLAALINHHATIFSYQYQGIAENGTVKTVGEIEVFIDLVLPKLTIVVVGGGHVGRQVVFLAKWLGYHVVLSDDRLEMCTPSACPGADEYIHSPLLNLNIRLEINENTYFVLTTRNADVDIEGLPPILHSKAGYIGVIGSEKRKISLLEGLLKAGVSTEQLSKIHSPIGLQLDAETPEEIALSILAEILIVGAQTKTISI